MKHPKMDKLLIASEQDYELDYVVSIFDEGCNRELVRELCALHNNSRRRVYAALEGQGYKRKSKAKTDQNFLDAVEEKRENS